MSFHRVAGSTVAALLAVGAAGCFGKSADAIDGGFDAGAFSAEAGLPVLDAGPTHEGGAAADAGPDADASEEASPEAGSPALTWSPASSDFGTAAIGALPTRSLTLTNSGTAGADGIVLAWSGAGAAAFQASKDGCTGHTLAPAGTCDVTVTFAPSATGADGATLTASSGSATAAATLSGTAVTASTLAFASVPAFGPTTLGQSAKRTATLTNSGGTTSDVVTLGLAGTDAASFALSADTCTGKTLQPSKSCTADVTFTPAASGTKAVSLGATVAGALAASTDLTGTAVTPATLAFSTAQPFGPTAVGQSAPQTLTLTNSGGAPTASLTVSLAGTDEGMFSTANDGCSKKPLAAGGTCTVDVIFTPTAAGSRSASIGATDGTVTGTEALTATGVPPATLTATGITPFGPVILGQAPSQTLTLTNGGGVATGNVGLVLGGSSPTAAAMYSVTHDKCSGAPLPAGASCSLLVTFTPSASGAQTATLTANAGSLAATAMLTGVGQTAAALNVAGTAAFVAPIGSSVTQDFAVTDTGDQATGPLTPSLTGSGAFKIAANTCTTLAGDGTASCKVSVTFTPTVAATQAATLSVAGTPGGAKSVTLGGVAQAVLAMSSPTAMNGVIGQPATTQQITVSNTGGEPTGALTVTLTGSAAITKTADGCNGTKLQPAATAGDTCAITLSFAPANTTPQSATLAVAGNPGGSKSATVDGTGANPVVAFAVSAGGVAVPTYFEFPGTVAKTGTSTQTFTVKNTGNVASGTMTISVLSGPFAQPQGTDFCTGHPLAAGQTCNFDLGFTPAVVGPVEGQFAAADTDTHVTLTAWGPGLYPGSPSLVTTTPDSLGLPMPIATGQVYAFGTVALPNSVTQTFTVTNYGTVALPTNFTAARSGQSSPLFTNPTNNCNTVPITAYGTATQGCTYVITFTTAAGVAGNFFAFEGYTYDGDLMSTVEFTATE